ncbi:CLUMA_CG000640, isoform A [Clunio marinus]|uniref:CLUMA_CG000640, isoform A n=1 Tax=Clunio marinus TaxID=568069 RepID=A0A1J1HKP3_9DIPT|nr:CLUMA_CG000640, isoform A [Clunio marinus]
MCVVSKKPARVPMKRSAPINFEFVRHFQVELTKVEGECCFLISAVCCFNSFFYSQCYDPDILDTEKLPIDPWRKCDLKLIGAICYPVSSDGGVE